ncbi:MAG: response regulator [bacterium]|nr:response regulator [bacterium]
MSFVQITQSDAVTQVKLLLVDDDSTFRLELQQRLQAMGLQLMAAGGCSQALHLMTRQNVDVVIMDMQMPGVDGIECLRQVKQAWPKAEVILLTGHASVQSGIEGMESGAFDYCLKPIDVPDLLDKVELAAQKALINKENNGTSE